MHALSLLIHSGNNDLKKSSLFETKKFLIASNSSSSSSKSFPLNDSFIVPNNPKSHIAKSGEYAGWSKILTFEFSMCAFTFPAV